MLGYAHGSFARLRVCWPGLAVVLIALLAGCNLNLASLFNPSFVDVVAGGDGTNQLASIENASGHVPVLFVNNTRFATELTSYLEELQQAGRLSGIDPEITDLRQLRPRVRMPVRVTFSNENFFTFEFVDGDGVIEQDVFSGAETDDAELVVDVPTDSRLTERDLTRLVATCDVAQVEIDGNVQVFVPVFLRTIDVAIPDFGAVVRTVEQIDPPQFRPVLADEVNDDLTVTLTRNYSIFDSPAPVEGLRCGAVVGIVLTGEVSVPFTGPETDPGDAFIAAQDEVPGYVNTDNTAVATVPGRFKFLFQAR